MSEVVKPFEDDPAKQARFELFLKEKYQGGLRAAAPVVAVNMSEAARARERLDFEAAAEAIEKGKGKGLKEAKLSAEHFVDFLATGGMRFTSGGVEVCTRCCCAFLCIYDPGFSLLTDNTSTGSERSESRRFSRGENDPKTGRISVASCSYSVQAV